MRGFAVPVLLLALMHPALADTILHLSESAHLMVHPDEIVAVLRAESTAATAAAAQAQVNGLAGRALDAAKQVPGITSATGFYQVWQITQPTAQWHASQTIDLTGHDGPAMLKLVGSLQGQGLAVERLAWQVAPETARKAEAEATKQALGAVRARAEEAAGILGLRFLSFREVRLGATQPPPILPRAIMMAAAPAAAAPPRVEAQDADIQASVEAEAVLVQP